LVDGITTDEEGYLIKKSDNIYVDVHGNEVTAANKKRGVGLGTYLDL
jgi:hypothetical protein